MGTRALDAQTWDEPRWVRILNRMEQRQAGIGLRFWGPPLWLEVTMDGPDSDAWSVAGADGRPDQPWNWQASVACLDAMVQEDAGADDATLLDTAGRYTVENLILNAVHEIGEWLRFDAQRCFTAHQRGPARDGVQGNGEVSVNVDFAPAANTPAANPPAYGVQAAQAAAVSARAAREAGPWRFTCLPGMSIDYGAQGPFVVGQPADPDPGAGPGSDPGCGPVPCSWSDDTLQLLDAPSPLFVAAVQRDVHRQIVRYEAAAVCGAFYIDGARPWHLAGWPAGGAGSGQPLSLHISFAPESPGTPGHTDRPFDPCRTGTERRR